MGLFNQRQIAFVFYPLFPEYIRLDGMPFAENIVRRLAASGWHIDLFLWNKFDSSKHTALFPENIHYKYGRMYYTTRATRIIGLTLRFARCIGYKSVFSVGTAGSYIGGIISTASRCPYVLLNDEFPSNIGDQSRWSPLERWGARRADVIVTPSADRDTRLREELRLDADKPFVTIRNTPEIILPLSYRDWHKLMGIPYCKKIFIHAGNVAEWEQVPEILTSVSYWPADAVLLLHSRHRGELTRYRQQLSHLDNPKRVFWSLEPLSEDSLNSLISYCTGSFALYRNTGVNNEMMGTSSGKLMRSIVCGTPVITSSFESLRFVTNEGLGIQVTHPAEIPAAIEKLMRDRESYRKRCERFAASEEILREKAWNKIVLSVRNAPNGVDLSPPGREPV